MFDPTSRYYQLEQATYTRADGTEVRYVRRRFCPPGAALEDEPPLVDGYVDLHNGGCNTDPTDPPFQPITAPIFCGVSGWYLDAGTDHRDTDWFLVDIPASGVLEITGDAERECTCSPQWVQRYQKRISGPMMACSRKDGTGSHRHPRRGAAGGL